MMETLSDIIYYLPHKIKRTKNGLRVEEIGRGRGEGAVVMGL